ncbi:MAG: hypothetical protein HY685_05885 [Chloroflexi bacterium]|nr:hypothetical protein [Chloroflexota bacterium]
MKQMRRAQHLSPVVLEEDGRGETLLYLRRTLGEGEHWLRAVLQAVRLWTVPAETYKGRRYQYLIGGEAFDWLLLVERFLEEFPEAAPEEERQRLLFHGQIPFSLTATEFRDLIGIAKYRAYLNFWYGVMVEEALQQMVLEEVCKERSGQGPTEAFLEEEAFRRIYGKGRDEAFADFRREAQCSLTGPSSLTEQKEFLYWLFKYRLSYCDPARVASDTKKGVMKVYGLRPDLFLADDALAVLPLSLNEHAVVSPGS